MNNIAYFLTQPQFYIPFLVWTIFWKGLALWKSAGKKQLIWFVLLLMLNTSGLLEILYVFFFNRWDIDNGKILNFLTKKFKKTKK